MADILNTRIDRYLIQERIGTGGMARVYRAIDTNLGRVVALKILHDHLADDPAFKERFEREARLIASLNHPNIVQVYDFSATESEGYPRYYMVMPFITGQTLRDVLQDLSARGETLPVARVLELMTELADALGYAHARGMIHRDVKPANIILNDEGKAILTDFGIARMVGTSRLTQEGITSGTPTYMSPEQATGQPGDGRTDLYALGVILFELLTGQPPYNDETGLSVMLKHVNAPVPRASAALPKQNPQLDAFLFRALAKDPNERYQTAQEFAADLRAIFSGSPITRTDPQAPVPHQNDLATISLPAVSPVVTAPPPRRAWLPWAGFALAGAAVVLALVALVGPRLQAPPPTATAAPTNTSTPSRRPPLITGSQFFTSTFDEDDDFRASWPSDDLGGFMREFTPEGQYHLRSERPGTASTAIFDRNYVVTNASIALVGTLQETSDPSAAYGIAFRYVDEDHYYVFAVDGQGRYSIWARRDGAWQELRDADENWTPHPAIHPRGGENRLVIDALGTRLIGYVNGEQILDLIEDSPIPGNVGIYLATHTTGISEALIDSYTVYPVLAPSMTGS